MRHKKNIYIFIRYSILSKSPVWALSKNSDINDYKNKLFSEKRLSFREKLFTTITLPSLANQKLPNDLDSYRVVVITSTHLPKPYSDNIYALKNEHKFLDIVSIDENESISDTISNFIENDIKNSKQTTHYATARLDDDDALNNDYLIQLDKYISPAFSNHIISFPLGIEAFYSTPNAAIHEGIKINYPKIAAGLAHINSYDIDKKGFFAKCKNIHQAGNHVKVDQKFPMVLDHSIIAYLRLVHDHQDGGITKGTKENEVGRNDILENFSVSEKYISLSK